MKLRKPTKAELKAKTKKYAPYVQAVISVAATAVAAYYMRENNSLKKSVDILTAPDPDAWHSIEIHPELMRQVVEDGAILKYRQRRVSPNRRYAQATTLPDFSNEMNTEFHADIPSEVGVGKKTYSDSEN